MSICKGDMVEMSDGTVGVVSKFSAGSNPTGGDVAIWHPYVARQLGKLNGENPFVVLRAVSSSALSTLRKRVVLSIFGENVFSEGHDD